MKLGRMMIMTLALLAAPLHAQQQAAPPAPAADTAIDKATRDAMAEVVFRALTTMYVERDLAPTLAAETKKRMLADDYVGLTPQQFAEKLTKDLQATNGDGHLYARYRKSEAAAKVPTMTELDATIEELRVILRNPPTGGGPGPRPMNGAAPNPNGAPGAGAAAINPLSSFQRTNWGFVETRSLEGNVGLLTLDRFAPPVPEAMEVAKAAMAMLANADAVIIDLRKSPGGVERMASHLASYFFADDKKLLMSAYFPFSDSRIDSWLDQDIPKAKRRPDVPLYILTSKKSFSSAEFFSYTLQKFGRATIVGETTGGGGYAGQVVGLGRGLFLSVSVGKPEHPVTKGGWQIKGVVPDIAVPADQALETAHQHALARLKEKSKS